MAKEVALLEKIGNDLKLPHSRSLKGKLFELRERKYAFRIYYAFYKDKIIVFLVAGDNKAHQANDIELARKRLKRLMNGGVTL